MLSVLKKIKPKYFTAALLVACILISCVTVFAAIGDNEVIHTDRDPLLTKEAIGDGDPWQAVTTFNQNEMSSKDRRLYDVKTDGYVLWFDHDDFDYFYKPYYFGYGRKASMSVETTVDSWEMPAQTASAGIALRSSLDKSAATAFLHCRQEGIFFVYRANDKAAGYSTPVKSGAKPIYPVRLKMVVENHKVKCYYANNGSDTFVEIDGSYTFNYSENIMVGLGTHSTVQKQATAVYEGLDISISAPKGTEYKEYGSGSDNPSSSDTSSTVSLPEDLPITDDVLFAETFTDGSMLKGEESKTNPVWDTNNKTPDENIQLDSDNLNRYLLLDSDGYYYFAGNRKMSDYRLNMDVNFSKESPRNEKNQFRVYVRHRYSPMTGHYYYYIDFTWDADKKQGSVNICKGYHNSNPINGIYPEGPTGKEISNGENAKAIYRFDYLAEEKLGLNHDLQIDVIDNKITVYWDDKQIAYGEDNDTSKFFNGFGGIGLYSDKATVSVDNIYVRKLEDYLGGDYDNYIGGKFDEKTPDYIDKHIKNNWVY